MESWIVETRGLKKYYQLGDHTVKALDGVDFCVREQEFVAIIGKSGSGKSTLLHMIGGLDVPTGGEVYAIILADELTGNLDTATSHDVMGLLKIVAREFQQTIILITHDNDVAQMADRIVHIEDGLIVKERDTYAGK